MIHRLVASSLIAMSCLGCEAGQPAAAAGSDASLWDVYQQVLARAKYVDLTHTITPDVPVWPCFG